MKLLNHLLAADLRRHRLLVALWLLVVIGVTTLEGLPTLAADQAGRETLSLLSAVLWLTKLLLRAVLVAAVVQTDPLVGTEAFWMTRPIPPLRLLVAKTVFLTLTVVIAPVVVDIALMIVYGVTLSQLARVAGEAALYDTFWMVLFMAGAALTRNLSRFVFLCVGTVAALALTVSINAVTGLRGPDGPPGMLTPPGTDDFTRLFVLVVMMSLTCGALLIVHTGGGRCSARFSRARRDWPPPLPPPVRGRGRFSRPGSPFRSGQQALRRFG
jgi:hypothetical protein